MKGLPVTIRLLDPPLHEFIPNAEELAKELERARIEESDEVDELEHTLGRGLGAAARQDFDHRQGKSGGLASAGLERDPGRRGPSKRRGIACCWIGGSGIS